MDINDIKRNVADNLARLRSAHGMTQAYLAEKLNYTDKAVSKWERAESVPDIAVLKQIADTFDVTVDWLISEQKDVAPVISEERIRAKKRNRFIISLLSGVAVLFIATTVFVVMSIVGVPRAELAYMWSIPALAIDFLVFNAIWGKYSRNFLFITIIIWAVPAAVYITVGNPNLWYLFFISVPLQIATFFWSQIGHPKKHTATLRGENLRQNTDATESVGAVEPECASAQASLDTASDDGAENNSDADRASHT